MSPSAHIIDLTHTLSSSTTPKVIYPGDPPFHFVHEKTIPKDGYSVHTLGIGSHAGTHVDAPCHFVEGGRSIDQIPLDELVGRGLVVDIRALQLKRRQKISWDDLEHAYAQEESTRGEAKSRSKTLKEKVEQVKPRFLLVFTGWSEVALTDITSPSFEPSLFFGHPYFSSSIARTLLSLNVKAFGTDLPNPDETPFEELDPSTGKPTTVGADGYGFHEVFLGADGLIVENMANLKELVDKGEEGDSEWVVNVIPLKLEGADGPPVRVFAYQRHRTI
ncbi:cyclase [Coprinopsis sp. MPI-PUGE-AT-0042]|nr:cyclase [Coprinopsis sp. MPI-PUGE-AT-0042]